MQSGQTYPLQGSYRITISKANATIIIKKGEDGARRRGKKGERGIIIYAYSRCCFRAVVSKMFSEVKTNEAFPVEVIGEGESKEMQENDVGGIEKDTLKQSRQCTVGIM